MVKLAVETLVSSPLIMTKKLGNILDKLIELLVMQEPILLLHAFDYDFSIHSWEHLRPHPDIKKEQKMK